MITSTHHNEVDNVVDLFTGKTVDSLQQEQIIRLSPEYDGLSMLYSNSNTGANKLYTMKILCWALRESGEVVAMIPWLNQLMACSELLDPQHGHWEGYYNPATGSVFYEAPHHKALELETAVHYFDNNTDNSDTVIQEIPDPIGTHAMLDAGDQCSLFLTEVISWRLKADGRVQAMLIDENAIASTPVLPGDECLYAADSNSSFRYFFQHHIANQIKAQDPDALAAISLLFDA